jgi:hypothetical protein
MPPRKLKQWLKTYVRVNEWQAKYIGLFVTRVA